MKKSLLILVTLTVFGCSGQKAPDESMVILRSEKLYLPPEYELLAPSEVESIKKDEPTVQESSEKLLLGKEKAELKSKENSWLINKAGGKDRIKNIKEVIKEDSQQAKK